MAITQLFLTLQVASSWNIIVFLFSAWRQRFKEKAISFFRCNSIFKVRKKKKCWLYYCKTQYEFFSLFRSDMIWIHFCKKNLSPRDTFESEANHDYILYNTIFCTQRILQNINRGEENRKKSRNPLCAPGSSRFNSVLPRNGNIWLERIELLYFVGVRVILTCKWGRYKVKRSSVIK